MAVIELHKYGFKKCKCGFCNNFFYVSKKKLMEYKKATGITIEQSINGGYTCRNCQAEALKISIEDNYIKTMYNGDISEIKMKKMISSIYKILKDNGLTTDDGLVIETLEDDIFELIEEWSIFFI